MYKSASSAVEVGHHSIPFFFFFFLRMPCLKLGLPVGSVGKESACNVGDLGSVPGLGRSPGGGHGNPL